MVDTSTKLLSAFVILLAALLDISQGYVRRGQPTGIYHFRTTTIMPHSQIIPPHHVLK